MNLKHSLLATAVLCLAATASRAADLRFHNDGKFKIVQLTDTHLRPDSADIEKAQKAAQMWAHILDVEKPDLVIFTGDVVTSNPYQKGIEIIAKILSERNIPWALTFGNHDPEQDLTYQQMADLLKKQAGFIGKMQHRKGVDGYGNYTLEIKNSTGKKTEAVLYCIDSHSFNPLKDRLDSYTWVTENQIEWYKKNSARYTRANGGRPMPTLAFFHIPTPEYKAIYQENGYTFVGQHNEGVCSPVINTGLIAAMIMRQDVMGVFVGHDHVNDYIFNYYGIALAYGRCSSAFKMTYGDLPLGARVIELLEGQRSFNTWIRLWENDAKLDEVNFPADLPMKK